MMKLMNFLKKAESGFAQVVILGLMALVAVALPVTTKLVQNNQENRSKAAEEGTISCNVLRDTSKKYFEVCAGFDNVCFNKYNGEYQGCGNINGSNGGDCTDPEHNTNANNNMLCQVNGNVSLSCETLYDKKQKYFAQCAGSGNTGVCFDKQTGEYKGCVSNDSNNCNDLGRILCSVKSEESTSWDNEAGKCGSAYSKTFESTPTSDLCESGDFSRAWFIESDHKYYWKCGNVEKYGNEAANCFAVVNGKSGSAKISLDRNEISLGVGKSLKINAKLEPANSGDSITWSTNLPEFFSVNSDGVITVLKANATGYVTAMTSGGYGASVMVNTIEVSERIDAVCGNSHGKTYTTRPEDNLCIGSVNSVGQMKGNKYTWVCSGVNGGTSAECWANIENSVSTFSRPFLFLKVDNNTYSVGQTFVVTAGVNSATNKIGGVDGVINYKTDVLSLLSVKKSSSFVFKNSDDDCVINKDFTNGKVIFTCFVGDSVNEKAVEGGLVILTFAVKHSGVSDISFECNLGAINESNIVADSKDIIDCSKNINQKISTNNGDLHKNTPTPSPVSIGETTSIDMVDGKCGSKRNVCNAGVVNDGALEDTSSEYKWKCLGLEGGKNVNCSLKKPITKKCLNSKTTQTCTGSVCIKKTCASGKTCVVGGCINKPASGKKPTVGQACGSFGVCIKTSGTTKNGDKCISTVNGGVGKIRINLCSGNNSIRCCEVK